VRANLVLTLIGDDRPGLVDVLARTISQHGGNWEESRMAHLAGKFAGLLRVTLPPDNRAALEAALAELQPSGLRIVVEASTVGADPKTGAGPRLRMELVGNDHEGIVRDLSHALATRDINVEELHTRCEDAPLGGGQLFRASALLQLPASLSVEALRESLEGLADDLMVELTFDPLETSASRT